MPINKAKDANKWEAGLGGWGWRRGEMEESF